MFQNFIHNIYLPNDRLTALTIPAIEIIIAHRCEIFYRLSAFRLFFAFYLSDTVLDTRGTAPNRGSPDSAGERHRVGSGFVLEYQRQGQRRYSVPHSAFLRLQVS